MQWSPRQKLAAGILTTLLLVSFGAWYAIERAVSVPEASHFLIPLLWFFVVCSVFLLGALFWQERALSFLGALFLMVPSAMQEVSWIHGGIVLLAIVLVYRSLRRIQEEMSERIFLSVRRILSAGLGMIVLAISLVISSQYYFNIRTSPWEDLVPNFDFAQGAAPLVWRTVQPLSPELARLGDTTVTVDTFLREVKLRQQGESLSQGPTDDVLWEAELARTKNELGRLLGREVLGTENMQTLLSEALHRKLLALFSSQHEKLPVPLLPLFLTILIFLTVYPLMAFLLPGITAFVAVLFQLLRRLRVVRVTTVVGEREVIEP